MKKKRIIAAITGGALAVGLGLTVYAAYDSSEDPIISLSYLRDIFKVEMMDEIDSRFAELEKKINSSSGEVQSAETTPAESSPSASQGDLYEVVELGLGDALYSATACDIILRAGSASCIAPDPTQGISDLTDAVEIYNGMSLTKNHLCLIPRGDGRGVLAESDSVFLMIRGDYTIVEK